MITYSAVPDTYFTVVWGEAVVLRPVGAGATGHASVVFDTLDEGLPYVYEYGLPSPRARTRK